MRRWIAPALGKRHSGPRSVRQKKRSDQMGYGQAQDGAEERQAERKFDCHKGGVEAGRARQVRGRDNCGYEAFVRIIGQRWIHRGP